MTVIIYYQLMINYVHLDLPTITDSFDYSNRYQ